MIRMTAAVLAFALCGGCWSWQGTYDSAARRECEKMVNAEDRQNCLTQVERNASEHRREQRS